MTIKRARELLGENIKDLSDKEVEEMLKRDNLFMDNLVRDYMSNPKKWEEIMKKDK